MIGESRESRSWFRRLAPPVRITLIVVVLLLVAGAAYWVYRELSTCGPGVDRISGQCIGVTDGSVHLAPDLADVLTKIQRENERIDQLGPNVAAVSIVYLLALPAPDDDDARATTLRQELEGAYLAQIHKNSDENDTPMIRLLVANDGDGSTHWHRVLPALAAKVNSRERLVAVVVTGQTVTERENSIGALLDEGLPVISSRLTGDNLAGRPDDSPSVQGLANVAPSNKDQVTAAIAYIKNQSESSTALLVQSSDRTDTYSQSLGDAFTAGYEDAEHELLRPVEEYDPRLDGVPATMRRMLRNICQQEPDTVFFAGRGGHLESFVAALPTRPCLDTRINIVTADSAVNLGNTIAADTDPRLSRGLQANASLRYTALAHPESWSNSPAEFFDTDITRPFTGVCTACYTRLFPDSQLDNGAAIMGHDAIEFVVSAIRFDEESNDEPGLIIQHFKRMQGLDPVRGASGYIARGDGGKPVNKAVPILEVKPNGSVEFVELSAPEGAPCQENNPQLCRSS